MVEICLVWGILFPFLGTVLGAGLVWLMNWQAGSLRRLVSGAAAGVMGWASVFSLLLPGMRMSPGALAGAVAGSGFLAGTARLTGKRGNRGALVALAVVLHNIPEGMATGVSFGSFLTGSGVSVYQALSVGLGIGLQNVPDGAMVSLPLRQQGVSRGKAFRMGVLSAFVEPLAAVAMLLWAGELVFLLPGLMGFAAGAMLFVLVTELLPAMELHRGKWEGAAAALAGVALMQAVL